MSPNDRDKPTTELASIYREHGDAEPDPGLDRIIRARADQAARRSGARPPAPWIGGLVTASVAVIAIAVVLRQAPTGAPDEARRPAPQTEIPAARSPAPAPGAAPESGAEGLRRSRTPEQAANDTEPDELLEKEAFSADRAAIIDENNEASVGGSGDARDRETAATAADTPLPEIAGDPASMVESIRALIEKGETDRARERAEALKRLHPAHALPDDVRALLDEPTGEGDG